MLINSSVVVVKFMIKYCPSNIYSIELSALKTVEVGDFVLSHVCKLVIIVACVCLLKWEVMPVLAYLL